MKRFTQLFFLFFFLFLSLISKEPLKDIRGVLTRDEFKQSGLEKLSEQELERLSGHLFGWKADEKVPLVVREERVAVREEETFGNERIEQRKRKKLDEPKFIASRIMGEFKGWRGKGRFKLENGQVWKQIDTKKFSLKRTNPEVEITRGVLGGYFLSVKGSGSRCRVERVK